MCCYLLLSSSANFCLLCSKELKDSIALGQELQVPEEEIMQLKRELFTLMRSSAVEKVVVVPQVEKAALDTDNRWCCCGCKENAEKSDHFCAKTKLRIMAWCAEAGSEEGAGSSNPCMTCARSVDRLAH